MNVNYESVNHVEEKFKYVHVCTKHMHTHKYTIHALHIHTHLCHTQHTHTLCVRAHDNACMCVYA